VITKRIPRKRRLDAANILAAVSILFFLAACENEKATSTVGSKKPSHVGVIRNEQEFKTVVESSKDRLLVFDFYADWCPPCKLLSPMLDEIAKEHRDKASFYKINIDHNQLLANIFQVTGIPYVVFVLNQSTVHALPGLRSKDSYVKAIKHYSDIGKRNG
jgi:thioredoxin 1